MLDVRLIIVLIIITDLKKTPQKYQKFVSNYTINSGYAIKTVK